MFRTVIFALGAFAASACSVAAAPLEAYGKLPSIERAAVSPSGALVAYVVTDGDKRSIVVQKTGDKVLLIGAAGNQKVRDLQWAGDEHVIITTSITTQPLFVDGPKSEFFLAQDLNLKTRRPRPLLDKTDSDDLTMNTITALPDVRTVGGRPVVFVRGEHFVSGRGQFGLFRINLDSGVASLVQSGGYDAYDWVIDPQGQVLAQASYGDASGVWKLSVKATTSWRAIQTLSAPIDVPTLAGFGRDGKSVLVQVDDEKTGDAWREVSLETGAWGETIDGQDGESTLHDPATGRLIGKVALAGDTLSYTFFDPKDAAAWAAVQKAYPGDRVSLTSWSDDRRKIIVRVDSASLGPAYALVNFDTGQATWISAEYLDLKPEDISPVRPVRYRAADGLEIPGYLTLPRGRDPHGLPLVVLVHGGPAARDEPGFDWWAQALASRGYAVLQTNYRGSAGFGRSFLQAGFGQWGRKMQTDLSDGVRDLARQGIVDPKRVCIVGGSYGGYAALAGATIDHGVYRCAASYGGAADLRGLISDFRSKAGREAQRYWRRFIGTTSESDPLLTRYSPVARAGEADIPVLLIHGRDDTVVPLSQSLEMAAALRAAGKPVELVQLPGEDHWLSTGQTRLAMLQAMVAFLEKNNPPN